LKRARVVLCIVQGASLAAAPLATAQGGMQWSGFATLRGTTDADEPFHEEPVFGQLQLGLDWSRSPRFLAHLHLLARTDDAGSENGLAGVPEAYLETNLPTGRSRFRLRGGAFFLPTSRENVDALWENPYAISSSALNTWFGEELRPIGLDLSWRRGGALLGATVFRGNDTLGALPPARGWALHDRWTLLGQNVPVDERYYTSVSAETDGRLGWSARAGWSGSRGSLLFTHLDNRSDALLYGKLYNWATRFDIAGVDATLGDWSLAAEAGWGPTDINVRGRVFRSDLRAVYALASRRMGRGRATLRIDWFDDGDADATTLTLAGFWTPLPRLRLGLELLAGADSVRGLLQVRYGLGPR
jgi:hypothetical protein